MRVREVRLAQILVLAGMLALLGIAWLSPGASGWPADASAAKTVRIKGFAFKPATLKVTRGSQVTFVNASQIPHTATRAGGFDTRRIAPGGSANVRFKKRGSFAYHCKIHPSMKGKIVVQ